MNPRLARGATALLAVVAVLAAPLAARADGGVVRDDDGTMENSVHVDYHDDYATKYLDLPGSILNGAVAATLHVYGAADGCTTNGQTQQLTVNYTYTVNFDPCQVFVNGVFSWASISVDWHWLVAGSTNTFHITETAGDWTTLNASYGIDSQHDYGRSDIHQSSTEFTGEIGGELMWYLEVFGGGMPATTVTPSTMYFGDVRVGSSGSQTITVRSSGTTDTTVSSVDVSLNPDIYSIGYDDCTGFPMRTGQSCSIVVTFRPIEAGARAGEVRIVSDAGTDYVALNGNGIANPDVTAPRSYFYTADNATLQLGDLVYGRSDDDRSSISTVIVTFTWLTLPLLGPTTSPATFDASGATWRTWSVRPPQVPGQYRVTVRATDSAGNQETPGSSITITVV